MSVLGRRSFLQGLTASAAGGLLADRCVVGQEKGERPARDKSARVINPRGRPPLSFIIDDSTCLVNLNRFAIPQFAAAWNNRRYLHDWRSMPLEIPDDFVRKFADWCEDHSVRGKYSIVPFPACVGRLDRELPGWTRRELENSLKFVRDRMAPNWDIHPEMVTHTRVIDTKTGHPYPTRAPEFMENWRWTDGKSVDELANYLGYALRILRNCDLHCDGITTPGGFGNRVLPELAQASLESVRDVYKSEIPHYFRHVISSGDASVEPRVEYVSGLDTDDPRCVVSIIACTGDWTGGWDCSNRGNVDLFITPDLKSGRMTEVIDRGEPALMLCHWTGIYFNGEEVGLRVFQEAVERMERRYGQLNWMKLDQIARYWAAKELTAFTRTGNQWTLQAPYACPDFTVELSAAPAGAPRVSQGATVKRLQETKRRADLRSGTFHRDDEKLTVCFPLPRGKSAISV